MSKTWIWSDQHFGHEKTCTVFKRADGTPLRPFASAEEMNEVMIARNNERVGRNDQPVRCCEQPELRSFLLLKQKDGEAYHLPA